MKRKVYTTRRERMIDQVLGFLAFPLVNVLLGIILWMMMSGVDSLSLPLVSVLPWLVNGAIIVLAFLLRPEFAIGYISFMGAAVAVVIALSVVVVAACFVIIPLAAVIGDQTGWVLLSVFGFLVGVGLVGLCIVAYLISKRWWSSSKK